MTIERPFLPTSPRGPYGPRLAALAVGFLAMAALRAQFDALETVPALGPRLWFLAQFFTVLTNLLVAGHMLAVAWGWRIGAARAAGLLVSILLVALVHHMLLARLRAPEGVQYWADLGLHTGVPLAMFLWWAGFAPKEVARRDVPGWLLWPVAYCAYALIRGLVTGIWPYPFLNVDTIGWGAVLLTLTGIFAALLAISAAIFWLAGRLRRYSRLNPS